MRFELHLVYNVHDKLESSVLYVLPIFYIEILNSVVS